MRKLILLSLALIASLASVVHHQAKAGTIPLLSGAAALNCQEPSQTVACANNFVNQLNSYFGLSAVQVGPINSTATTNEQILSQTPIAPGTLIATGQSLKIHCGGTTGADTNTKTVKLYFGAASITTPAMTTSGINWEMELLVTLAATPNTVILGRGSIGGGLGSFAALVTPIATNDTFDNLSAAVTAKCTTTQGTASANDTVLEDFMIELVK